MAVRIQFRRGTGLTGGGTGGNKTLSIDPTVVLQTTEFDAKGDI